MTPEDAPGQTGQPREAPAQPQADSALDPDTAAVRVCGMGANVRYSSGAVSARPPVVQPGSAPPEPLGLTTFRALRHRNYRLFFLGQLVSLTGSWVQTTALMWLAFDLSGTSRWPALVGAAQIAPTFFLGALGGVLADHLPKRRLLLLTQSALLVLALLLAGLVVTGLATVWHLFAVALVCGLVNAVDLPVRLSFVHDMVGRDDLMNAVALNSLLFNTARALGPALGTCLLEWWGPAPCFFLNALSYLAILGALLRMQVPLLHPAHWTERQSWRAGFHYVAHHPTLLLLLCLTGAMALCGWPILALLPALSQNDMTAGESGYSWMLSAIGVGALTSTLLVASFGSLKRRRRFLGTGLVVAALALIGLSLAPNLVLGMICCSLLGLGLVMFFSTSQATVQLSAGDHNRGRVMGIYSIVLSGATPLGTLLAGTSADRWGVVQVVRVQGLAMLIAAMVIVALLRRARRRTPTQRPLQPEMEAA